MIRVEGPIRTISVNVKEHWASKSRRVNAQKRDTLLLLAGKKKPALPVVVTFTRFSNRTMDLDNLQGALKAVRDAVAFWLRVDDGPGAPVTWVYEQARGMGPKLRIELSTPP